MRSSTHPDLKDRCRACYLQERCCICPHIEPVSVSIDVVVVRHWKESWRSSNTGRLAGLAIPQCSVQNYGGRGDTFDTTALLGPQTFLLFPSLKTPTVEEPPSLPLTRELGVRTLVVLDSTWSQARKLVRRIAPLRGMPRVHVQPSSPEPRRLRRPPFPGGMGTFEAIARAVEVLDGPKAAATLMALHSRFVTHALAQSG